MTQLSKSGLASSDQVQWSVTGDQISARDDVLAKVAELAPLVRSYTAQFERERRLPAQLIDAFKSARIYGLMVPKRYGGLALEVPDALRVISELAKLDGSVGWNAMIGHVASLAVFLTRQDLCEHIFADGKDHILAGSSQPTGTAERVPAGWRVTGTWPFASGCKDAEWISGACVMMEGGAPIPALDRPGPLVRHCFLPADRWHIHDTWHTAGMRGTGSHHVELRDAFVEDRDFLDFPFGVSFAPDPIFSMFPEYLMFAPAALAIGIAEGALADLIELAGSGVKQVHAVAPLVDTERFREGVGRFGADLMAACALLLRQSTQRWRTAQLGAPRDMARVTEAQQAATWIVSTCVRVTDGCFELAGTRAIYDSSPLHRRMRDIHVAAQHAAVHPRNFIKAGEAALVHLTAGDPQRP